MKTEVLGVAFDNLTPEEALEAGIALAQAEGFHYVVTPNPEFLRTAKVDEAFRQALNQASLVLPDGIGVIYGAKILGTPLKQKLPGIEFAEHLMEKMAEEKKTLYLLGAKPGIAEQAAEKLRERYPGLVIAGTHDGYFQKDEPVVADIRASMADVVFVCLGAPKQEKWMARNGTATGAHLLLGLGGSLDVFAGVVQRAPEIFSKTGMEWFYRLLKQPSRIGRMMKLPLFLVHVVGKKGKTDAERP